MKKKNLWIGATLFALVIGIFLLLVQFRIVPGADLFGQLTMVNQTIDQLCSATKSEDVSAETTVDGTDCKPPKQTEGSVPSKGFSGSSQGKTKEEAYEKAKEKAMAAASNADCSSAAEKFKCGNSQCTNDVSCEPQEIKCSDNNAKPLPLTRPVIYFATVTCRLICSCQQTSECENPADYAAVLAAIDQLVADITNDCENALIDPPLCPRNCREVSNAAGESVSRFFTHTGVDQSHEGNKYILKINGTCTASRNCEPEDSVEQVQSGDTGEESEGDSGVESGDTGGESEEDSGVESGDAGGEG